MSKIKQTKNLKASKKAKQNFKLVSYTIKATIPTGQYANIQPEVTVTAETIEQAERAVMPYIETLFARYRDGGVRNIEAPKIPVASQKPASVAQKPSVATVMPPVAPIAPAVPASTNIYTPPAPVAPIAPAVPASTNIYTPPAPVTPSAIVLTVPFTRAKGALDSCTSLAALKLVSDQVEKSTKLVDWEKAELRKISADKLAKLNG